MKMHGTIARRTLVAALLSLLSSLVSPAWSQGPPPELESAGGTLLLNAYTLSEVDDIGRTWKEDTSYVAAGTNIAVFAEEFVTFDLSLLSDPHVPYSVLRTERWRDGDVLYQIPVRNAPYKVFLYFMEFCYACVGPAMGGTGCAGCARIFDAEVEGNRYFAYNQSDAAVGAPSDGVGATFKATELVFDATVTDSRLNIAIIDRGGGNPPENSSIKGMKIIRMPSELDSLGGTLRLNAGSAAEVVDSLGRHWRPDESLVATPGSKAGGAGANVDVSGLEDPNVPPAVFATERSRAGGFKYEIPVPAGVYETRLYFSESCAGCVSPALGGTGCGSCTRSFDVDVEGKTVFGFVPADAALRPEDDHEGVRLRASELVYYTEVKDNFLTIDLRDLGALNPPGNPIVNAIQITRLDAQVLRSGSPVEIGLQAGDPEKLFLVEPTLKQILVTATPVQAFSRFSLYTRWQGIPSAAIHDDSVKAEAGKTACIAIGGRPRGSALLLARTDYTGNNKFEVNLLAQPRSLVLKSMTPNRAAADESGAISASVEGLGFNAEVAFKLKRHNGSAEILPREAFVTSSTRAEIVFDAAGAPLGGYDLIVERTGPSIGREPETAILESAFTLTSRVKGALVAFSLEGLGTYRRNEISSVILRYRNEGDADAVAPLFKIEGPNGVQFRLRDDDEDRGNAIQVLGIDEENVAGRLAPSARWHEAHVYFTSSLQNSTELKVSLLSPTASDVVPWLSLPTPDGLTAAQWQNLRGRLPAKAGNTWLEYREALARTATRSHRRGGDASNVSSLFRFISRQALDRAVGSVSGQMAHEASGEPVKDVAVVARVGGSTQSFGRTDQDGFFTIDSLQPGQTFNIAISGWDTPGAIVTMPADGDVTGVNLFARPLANGISASCPVCQETGLPNRPVVPPVEVFAGTRSHLLTESLSVDPNDKSGPSHPENPGMESTECAGVEMRYQIRFENLSTASAAAWDVTINDTIDDSVFDLTSFRFLEVVLPGKTFPLTTVESGNVIVPSGGGSGVTETVEGVGVSGLVCVNVKASFDVITGRMTCLLEAVDPVSGGVPSSDLLGVVAPGEHGSLSFTVTLDTSGDIDEGSEVKNSGEIIFDSNPAIETNEFQNSYSRCLPEEPRSPIPNDRVDRGVGPDVALGWVSANAATFDVFLGVAGAQRAKVATDIKDRGFRPTGIVINKVYEWQVVAKNARGNTPGPVWRFSTAATAAVSFRRGDSNADGKRDVSDAVFTLRYLFSGGVTLPCDKAADVDDSGKIDISDPVNLLGHLFSGNPAPPPPFATCGSDPTSDQLKCVVFGACP